MQDLSVFLKAIGQFSDDSASPEFAEDVLNYAKYTAITNCPDDKRLELNQIFEQGIGEDFAEFCVQNIPDFIEKLQKYITEYVNS